MNYAWGHIAAVSLFALGILHMLFGVARFRHQMTAIVREGVFDRCGGDDERRLACWFIAFGAPLSLCGHLALRASEAADLATLGLIGLYGCVTASAGVIAFPRSPLWGLLAVSMVLIAVGQGWLM